MAVEQEFLNRVEERLRAFRADLVKLTAEEAVRRHITFGTCFMLDDAQYFNLKEEVAGHFSIHPSEVLVVGSAKLGFSIKPSRRFLCFGEESDVDVAIISPELFDRVWRDIFVFRNSVGYWELESQFKDYLFRGWIRPDKLPPTSEAARRWWEFFRRLTQHGTYGPYKITAGLYKSWYFLESYQSICIQQCREL